VAYDPKHNQWMIASIALDGAFTGRAVILSRSAAPGTAWGPPSTVWLAGSNSQVDQSWIVCDSWAVSPYYGNCYVEWSDPLQGNQFHMLRSADGGLTWTVSSVPNEAVVGGQPVVQPSGTVVVPITGVAGLDSYVSTNGGSSYAGPYPINTIITHGALGMRDGARLASAEVDGSGKVYVAWMDCRFRPSCGADDIVLSTSSDGKTWSAPARIPAVPLSSPIELFLPGFGVDHATSGTSAHLLLTVYYLSNVGCSPPACTVNAGFMYSSNGGATWTGTTIFGGMAENSLPDAGGYFLGDYISTSFASTGKAFPVIPKAFLTTPCVLGGIFCSVQ
jgi:hypothetical protein